MVGWARARPEVDITQELGVLAVNKNPHGKYRTALGAEEFSADGDSYAEFTWVDGDILNI